MMQALDKDLRSALERTVKAARTVAETAAYAAVDQLGVGHDKPEAFLGDAEKALRNRLRTHGKQLGDARDSKSTNPTYGKQEVRHLVEEVAYEHWHRMLFARFLADNNLLMYDGVPVTLSECEELAADENAQSGWELAGKLAAQMLPQIFRPDSPVFQLIFPQEHQHKLERLVAGLPSEVFTAIDSLGWVYQFWQANNKEKINKSGVKIGANELPAVTQLFTENYMVDFLLDNTLGAWHAGKILATNPRLAETAASEDALRKAVSLQHCAWQYLRFVKDENNRWTPAAGTYSGWHTKAAHLKCLDPCMGSGHFVVAIFERLVALRMHEENLDEKSAVTEVIRENLFGLEVDPRCTQIGAFNLALAAWRRVGHCGLPPLNLACSGLAPNTADAEWLAIAGDDQKLRGGMERLYRMFEKASVLGSLIDPRSGKGDLLAAAFDELKPLVEKALAQEVKDDAVHEMAVTARGLAKAAEILADQFTLVATNVPFLGYREMSDDLVEHVSTHFPDEKGDLGYCLWRRFHSFVANGKTTALVTLQHWLSLRSYTAMRESLLTQFGLTTIAHLGTGAFETISGEKVNVTLTIATRSADSMGAEISLVDAVNCTGPTEKSNFLRDGEIARTLQKEQYKNPDHRISFGQLTNLPLLSKYADCLAGIMNGDTPKFIRNFWEIPQKTDLWAFLQSTVSQGMPIGGLHSIIYFDEVNGHLREDAFTRRIKLHNADERGNSVWGRAGVAISQMSSLPVSRYFGNKYDSNIASIVPKKKEHLPAIWAFCSSESFYEAVRAIDRKLNVTNATFGKVPFDLARWQKIADDKYPAGLPKPFSSDPTQWLFSGHPLDSDQPLHVAVARMLGYVWPRQSGSSFPDCPALAEDGLERHADRDGIVCLPALGQEASASERLLNLLAAAYGNDWSSDTLAHLLTTADHSGKSLDSWLRDKFFSQHCKLFLNRPFIWHVWDGLSDGFSALVNYHKLDYKRLESLIYTYLGDWVGRQKRDADNGVDGAEEKLAAAELLKKRLELILAGEAPYDIFVRWKPIEEQPIGWNPDLNDGVRLNIRPFISVPDVGKRGAGVLRDKPNIKWEKDRGSDVPSAPWYELGLQFGGKVGDRINDRHLSLEEKQKTRSGK